MVFVEEHLKTPVIKSVDVVVVGAGPAGVGAAVAAARNGAKTLLIERYGFLGGMLTAGLVLWLPVDKLTPLTQFGEKKALQGGIIQELVRRLVAVGGSVEPEGSYQTAVCFETYFPTDPELMKIVLQEMILESGVELMLHSLQVGAITKDNELKGVITESKSGRQAILAKVVIDASGDADVAAAAGAPFEKVQQPLMMTLMGTMANVDVARAIRYARNRDELDELAQRAIGNGDLTIEQKKVLPEAPPVTVTPPIVNDPDKLPANWYRRGEVTGWIDSVRGDCTSVNDLTKAEIETRKPILSILNFFRKYVPGYESAYLSCTATQVGLRESRRVRGEYYLTFKDNIKKGLRHKDTVAKCRAGGSRDIETYSPDRAPIFDIPYGCLVPTTLDGLLIAGRCISVDHVAATVLSPRDESTCMCLGEAAGCAAALSVKKGIKPRQLDVKLLQEILTKHGANLD